MSDHYLKTNYKEYGSIDYDLFVINAENEDTTTEELRDCIYDALERIDERLNIIEAYLNKGGKK